jgi:hypothetical protein
VVVIPDYNKEFEEYYKLRRKKKKPGSEGPCAMFALAGIGVVVALGDLAGLGWL